MLRFSADPPPLEVPPPLLPMWGKRYAGQVDQQGFRLVALTKFKQPYLPVFAGGFVPEGSRTRVQGYSGRTMSS